MGLPQGEGCDLRIRRGCIVFEKDTRKWAEKVFGDSNLGDVRRVDRLVDYAARQAEWPSASTNSACGASEAAAEGAFRVLRNKAVVATDIDDGVFDYTAHQCGGLATVLLIQDTTEVAVVSRKVAQPEDFGSGDGFQIHSCLAVNGLHGEPIGLLGQQRWMRELNRPSTALRATRAYKDKESYKWESTLRGCVARLTCTDNVIHVADREGDIYEYLVFLQKTGQRFVQRASTDRAIANQKTKLRNVLTKATALGSNEVKVKQRGPIVSGHLRTRRPGRSRRTARVEIRTATVTIERPKNADRTLPNELTVNVVWAHEPHAPKGSTPLDWLLLTSESIATAEHAQTVIGYYERRWLIEEFHKAWKTGCAIERRALKSRESLQVLYAITAPIAVRLLQLRCAQDCDPQASCEQLLSAAEWCCLYRAVLPDTKRLPKAPPTMQWAVQSIARLVGWRDSKRTGRIGWDTMWRGWSVLQERLPAAQTPLSANGYVA